MTLGKYLAECMMIAVHEQLAGSVTVFFHKILIIWSTDYFWYNPLLMTEIFCQVLMEDWCKNRNAHSQFSSDTYSSQ